MSAGHGGSGHAGGGHPATGGAHTAAGGGLEGHERSAALPASIEPSPSPPLIAPTGNVAVDALAGLVNSAAQPWQDLPTQSPIQKVATVVNGVLGLLNMDIAVDAFNLGVGAISSLIPWPSLPAATLGMPHIGSPHTHLHPPSLVPPAPPIPLPSIGTVAVGGCVSVLIGGMPAARAGDLGLALTCGTFAPPFEIAMGSSSVFIGGSRAARMGDMTKHCGAAVPSEFSAIGTGFAAAVGLLNAAAAPNAAAAAMAVAQTAVDAAKAALAALMGTDPGAPPCLGAVMMGNPTVLIGGFPIPPIENFARAFFQKLTAPLAGLLHGIVGRTLGKGRAANFFHELVCHTTGHPVDVANGRVLTSAVDLQLPGPIPLVFKRQYASSWCDRDSVLGWGWSHAFDQAVWVEPGSHAGKAKAVYRAEDGREIEFELERGANPPAWLAENERWDRFNRLKLRALGQARNQRWEIESADGLVREFAPVAVEPTARMARAPSLAADLDRARLQRIRDRAGNAITLRYDARGNLDTIIDSGGREIRLESDRAGRLTRVLVPHPTANGFVEQARYGFSPLGDLVQVVDPLGHAFELEYTGHHLTRETNRNKLSFYFAYQGSGPTARCVKTWGDGGIYERTLIYDVAAHVTRSFDSYGHATTYQMNEDNAVVQVTDALGGVTKYEFDDAYHKISETDPVGGETKWEYDERGNCTKTIAPDGATIAIEFNERNQPFRAVDAMSGAWQWGYDVEGLLIGRIDPLDRRVQFSWARDATRSPGGDLQGERPGRATPKRLIGMVDPAGQQMTLRYDPSGSLAAVTTPDGAETRWRYDALGRCVVAIDAKGNVHSRTHDDTGRLVQVREPDGNVRELDYDAEGNAVHIRDRQLDVGLTYTGMGRPATRTEAGTTVAFEYDLEERLIEIENGLGHVYRFEVGPTGQVDMEIGFDGLMRRYERDRTGRVTRVLRPGERRTSYGYDARGRLTDIKHGDGSAEAFVYRADGQLVQAKNDAVLLTLERDALGRLVKEVSGEDWVTCEYDALGMRARVRSSKGLDQRIGRNAAGDTVAVRAQMGSDGSRAPGAWEAMFQRDALGQELSRSLPGGVEARWERDRLGRPIRHEIWSGGTFKGAWQYSWEPNDRLRLVIDALKGPVEYRHDALGSLAAAVYEDGRVDLRMPDAVGNLFRTETRDDRKYGAAGQLLEAREPDGRVLRYDYDPEGNLVGKVETAPGGVSERVWTYAWNGSGKLAKVVRPDGDEVTFAYDALGRRLAKTFRGRTTRWMWDGDVPLHEWVDDDEVINERVATSGPAYELALDELAARRRRAELAARPSQGPPSEADAFAEAGTPSAPITWLFETEGFAPLGKLVGNARYSIITDHIGTPRAMYDDSGREVWSASIDAYGNLRNLVGARAACPFRWPGQYEDEETGLYYNRFRYYDPGSGSYIQQDPIRLAGGDALYGYPGDPTTWLDPLGLAGCGPTAAEELPPMKGMSVGEAEATLAAHGFTRTNPANPRNQRWVHTDGSEAQIHAYGGTTPGPFKSGNNAHVHKDIGRHGEPGTIPLNDRGIPSHDPAQTHIGISNPADFPTVAGRRHGT